MAKKKVKQPEASQAPVPQAGVAKGYKITRRLTMPTLTMKEPGQARILRFDSKMELSTYIDPDPKKQKEKPATVSNVTDMQTGEIFKFLVPSVVESNLRRDYDAACEIEGEGKKAKFVNDNGEHSYVGKSFQIQCMGKRPGKRYRDFAVAEVEAE